MKAKRFDAVEMKRELQREAERKMSALSESEQLELLKNKLVSFKSGVMRVFQPSRGKCVGKRPRKQ
jgi:hypothetical protein